MSNIQITVHVDSGTTNPVLAARVADQLAEKVEALEVTIDGVTAVTHHTVTGVKVGKAK